MPNKTVFAKEFAAIEPLRIFFFLFFCTYRSLPLGIKNQCKNLFLNRCPFPEICLLILPVRCSFLYLKCEKLHYGGLNLCDFHGGGGGGGGSNRRCCQRGHSFILLTLTLGVAVAQCVERATPGEEVPGLIPAVAALSLLVELV